MTNIDDLTIGQGKALASMFGENVKTSVVESTDEGVNIVVLERGFVYVGYVRLAGDFLYITQAKNIRRWGTSKGLGELSNGPLSSTAIDTVGDIKAPVRALIHLIKAQEGSWKKYLLF